jgi:hypothetical protein
MVLHQGLGEDAVPGVHRGASSEAELLDIRAPDSREGRVALLEGALCKRITEEGLDGVRLFSTILERRVVTLGVRMIRMWEYTGPADPD